MPTPIDAESESTTWISAAGMPCAASPALLNVAESLLPIVTQTIASAPAASSAAKAAEKSPGDAAAVVGNGASGAIIRVQNSSVDRSTPARNSSSPKRT